MLAVVAPTLVILGEKVKGQHFLLKTKYIIIVVRSKVKDYVN